MALLQAGTRVLRVFGYSAGEAIGQPITLVIPRERHNEEQDILTRIRRGERIDHFETVRQHKHGNLIVVSLSVSPVKDASGKIVGASKIARDITEQKRNRELIVTLAREAEHRSKNLLATNEEDGQKLRNYWTNACKTCPLKSKCTPSPQRPIKRWVYEDVLERAQARLDKNTNAMRTRLTQPVPPISEL
jgi:PAS domain S-box-containing protein